MILALAQLALARPTESGLYRFDETDVVTYVDSENGLARVYYSTEGPNVVKEGDEDGNGVPDFAELVGAYTEDVLATYVDAGFRPVVSDEGRGGSDAMDVYLVDFGGDADGAYSPETCDGDVCSGYFTMENDFQGYGYSNVESAVSTLTSHELFHAEQAAYNSGEESWYAEGTAVWAERFFDPTSEDFVWFCGAYLEDTGRSLNVPPTGPVPTFAYATAIWWEFVTLRYGDDWMVDYLDASGAGEDLVEALDARVDLRTDFVDFAGWNLRTGRLAGGMDQGYDFAAEIGPPTFEDSAGALDDDQRFYPLATTYYKLKWDGGDLQFGLEADAPDLVFQLWETDADGVVTGLVAEPASVAGLVDLGELPGGDYYLLGVNPTLAENSTKVRFCLGADATACAPAGDSGDTGDTGGAGTDEPGGCGCGAAGVNPSGVLFAAALAALVRRRSR